ncbi:MAG: class I SAM-dependent methyltransferase [Pseudomonadota bacterium]
MTTEKTKEAQYQHCIELRDSKGLARLGLMSNQVWHDDPKRLAFLLSRYKFVAKMLSGMAKVLEVGCGDAFGTRIVLQEVGELTAVDFDPAFVRDAAERMGDRWKHNCEVHDILEQPVDGMFDGAYALDVLEHIPREQEQVFLTNITGSLAEHGVLIIGTPSIQSQAYASAPSKEGHVNCKNNSELRDLMSLFFHNVFIFSMNDEVVHTGFYPMAHYFLALCCSKRTT